MTLIPSNTCPDCRQPPTVWNSCRNDWHFHHRKRPATPCKATTVYMDMDGVLCNFVRSILRLFDVPDEVTDAQLWAQHPGEYQIQKVLGISVNQMWDRVEESGSDFWANLLPYPWMEGLWRAAKTHDRYVCILSSPSYDPQSLAGKLMWLQNKDRFGRRFRDHVFTGEKQLLARPDAVLIDDSELKINAFIAAGGQGLLFQQSWNTGGLSFMDIIERLEAPWH